ncbi:NAD(P)/FAD-dependent oxidoreductase [Cognatiyoonia sp. IB215182]|uniref:NAD(P)/FAD-dependent oxidoreductase n=1 Tax=Cognatiyoonia sp. IB215182 TaxID=3097353 RepID=UPI002A1105E3|nr:FAD-dependent oxidoreductase [Cognatiyoonia sp. IB215182]MDX8355328.1 FAD-dependent oxidoreductase [Cognatiyoonia sp. IB215182]
MPARNETIAPGMPVAVVGAGAAGLAAVHALSDHHPVLLFEPQSHLGGHANTFVVPNGPDEGLALDVGFMVFNPTNYPVLTSTFELLGVETQPAEMSFAFEDAHRNVAYALNFQNAGQQAASCQIVKSARALSPLLKPIIAFFEAANEDLANGIDPSLQLRSYLEKIGVPEALARDYVYPMGAAIWSCDISQIGEYPAQALLSFFQNHGLLTFDDGPQWLSVKGGSQTYVDAIRREAKNLKFVNEAVSRVGETPSGVMIETVSGDHFEAAGAVIATQADQAREILETHEKKLDGLLSAWEYTNNTAVLHTDHRAMPRDRDLWAGWNHLAHKIPHQRQVSSAFSYYLNRLQSHDGAVNDYFVTLNPQNLNETIDPAKILARYAFRHPLYTARALATQKELAENTWGRVRLCGNYFGYGFHEDAFRSGLQAAESLTYLSNSILQKHV